MRATKASCLVFVNVIPEKADICSMSMCHVTSTTRSILRPLRPVQPAPLFAWAASVVGTLAAPRRVAAAPQDEVVARAAGNGVRTVPVVAAVQQRDAGAVREAHLLGRRRARLLVRAAAHAAEEEATTLEGSAEADVERHVGAVDVEGELGVLALSLIHI